MARAPSQAAAARARAAREKSEAGDGDTSVSLTWRGRDLSFSMNQLGPGDDGACRAQTKKTFGEAYAFSGFVSLLRDGATVGTDILATILWMARRKNGEPDLELSAVFDEVGTNEQLMRELTMAPAKKAAAKSANGSVIDVGEAGPPGG